MGNPTAIVQRTGRTAMRLLQDSPHVSRQQLAAVSRVSPETAKRALEWLRDAGAPVEYVPRQRAWVLLDKRFALPLLDPTKEDLQATLTAAGLMHELGLQEAAQRARALFNELTQRLGTKARPFRPDALRVTQAATAIREPTWMLLFLCAARRGVLRVKYRSPWRNEMVTHTFEPWQVWLHNGTLYVRGYSRTRKAARTFRLASVEQASVLEGERPVAAVPDQPWGEDDPRAGIDLDRPGTATIRMRGAIARWVATSRWHPKQADVWVEEGEVLERQLPYRSCRELARRLASFADGIERIAPAELRGEVLHLLERGAAQLRC